MLSSMPKRRVLTLFFGLRGLLLITATCALEFSIGVSRSALKALRLTLWSATIRCWRSFSRNAALTANCYLLTANKACGISAAGRETDLDLVARLNREFAANVMLRVFIRVGSILERLDFPLARA